MRIISPVAIVVGMVLALSLSAAEDIDVSAPENAVVFNLCELRVTAPAAIDSLPETQINDAYDADRDGRYVRLSARFSLRNNTIEVPGFAMRERPGGPWQWRVRWSPTEAGEWHARVTLEACTDAYGPATKIAHDLAKPIIARVDAQIEGPLVIARAEHPSPYLRRLKPDGSSEAIWLFGACRAWVADSQDSHNDWSPDEWLDRETELFTPMRAAGYNLLNQWMAPWEFLLVHYDRAEFWKINGKLIRVARPEQAAWAPLQCYDQGRARAFDELVQQCEGGAGKPALRLLLSPLPHQCLQAKEHPWGGEESGWSPDNDAGKQSPERLNGFSAFKPKMNVWEFFAADPGQPLDDWRSQLFDQQANFYRYVIARWGYSRAIGVWVPIDELDAVGDVVGNRRQQTGWWGHPECARWLADVIRLFRGELIRADGMRYQGDPFRHPLHAATTSYGGEAARGGNIDWDGGPADARPDLFGFHWYPSWPERSAWTDVWTYTVDGIGSYSAAPIGAAPRLISEFGAPDRDSPKDDPSALYPTLYHHAIWAAIFSGQAGTPMDWDDGKQFGELTWRERKGLFDREHYPISNANEMRALKCFLVGLSPENLRSCVETKATVTCAAKGTLRVFALYSEANRQGVYGWLLAPATDTQFALNGLPEGKYALEWFDPWTGQPIPDFQSQVLVAGKDGLQIDADNALRTLRAAAEPFPEKTRQSRGQDAAFKLKWAK